MLKVGDSAGAAEANKVGLRVIIVGSVLSAAYALLSDLKLVKSALTKPFKTGDSSGSMVGVSMSMALIGVGHLVGIAVPRPSSSVSLSRTVRSCRGGYPARLVATLR